MTPTTYLSIFPFSQYVPSSQSYKLQEIIRRHLLDPDLQSASLSFLTDISHLCYPDPGWRYGRMDVTENIMYFEWASWRYGAVMAWVGRFGEIYASYHNNYSLNNKTNISCY